jgi:hypothetical protein
LESSAGKDEIARIEAGDPAASAANRAVRAEPGTGISLPDRIRGYRLAMAWAGSASGGPLGSQSPSERA